MTDDEIPAEQVLERLFAVVLEEARTNGSFAEKLVAALPSRAVVRIETRRAKSGASRKTGTQKEQPVSLTRLMNREGEPALREFLKKRNTKQLRDLVERQQIPIGIGGSDRDLPALRDAIVEGVKFRIADRLAAAS